MLIGCPDGGTVAVAAVAATVAAVAMNENATIKNASRFI